MSVKEAQRVTAAAVPLPSPTITFLLWSLAGRQSSAGLAAHPPLQCPLACPRAFTADSGRWVWGLWAAPSPCPRGISRAALAEAAAWQCRTVMERSCVVFNWAQIRCCHECVKCVICRCSRICFVNDFSPVSLLPTVLNALRYCCCSAAAWDGNQWIS